MEQKFIDQIVDELLENHQDLSKISLVVPGKRPIIFFKKRLKEKKYCGFLPNFVTIEELIEQIAQKQPIKGISIWLFAFSIYQKEIGTEDFENFLKWFPTLLKDWDDMMKFHTQDTDILNYMLDEERIKNWSEKLADEKSPRTKHLNFWKNAHLFLPKLKIALTEKNWATAGMFHVAARENLNLFIDKTQEIYIFCGFNALTPIEEALVRGLMQVKKAICYFQSDEYYQNSEIQEAGTFLRTYKKWKEFGRINEFRWIENNFAKPKNIHFYEVPGTITQTKTLPTIFSELGETKLEDTALVLLDENLLPATLEVLEGLGKINITMGFPLKNAPFSNCLKLLFHIQKRLKKNPSSYYYKDIIVFFESLPKHPQELELLQNFQNEIVERNKVYLSPAFLEEKLSTFIGYKMILASASAKDFLDNLLEFCADQKSKNIDDIFYETISLYENAFRTLKNLSDYYALDLSSEIVEILINQLIQSESIDFIGEPLEGLQVMGLLETRLLNFKNVILLSANEGKLPLGNNQNTYIPFDVRKAHGLHTFLENDAIYAYHFYRLIQSAENVYLLYNSLSTGLSTGEKSRFLTQLELESPHKDSIKKYVVESASEPTTTSILEIEKTTAVIDKLEEWKLKITATHLSNYIYNPFDFYLKQVLKANPVEEVEEELSKRNFGNLVHFGLQFLYEQILNKKLTTEDFRSLKSQIDVALQYAIESVMCQDLDFYKNGMNFIHKSLAKKSIEAVLNHDLELIEQGNVLIIKAIERKFENIIYTIETETKPIEVAFKGFIDRIDELNGQTRIIDYKTGKKKILELKNLGVSDNIFLGDNGEKYVQALQLCLYLHYAALDSEIDFDNCIAGIWSLNKINLGVEELQFIGCSLTDAMKLIGELILEILNPKNPFFDKIKFEY